MPDGRPRGGNFLIPQRPVGVYIILIVEDNRLCRNPYKAVCTREDAKDYNLVSEMHVEHYFCPIHLFESSRLFKSIV